MSSTQVEIILIASVVALSCSLLGVFLVLKKMAMMSDAITHTILLGIVIGFFITHDFNSPLLIIGAAITGVLTVYLIEMLQRTRLLSEESSIGVVFPLLFSIAIILITRYAGSVHLDTDAVLLGEISFAPFDRMMIFGLDIPKSLFTGIVILGVDALFVLIFFKELKLTSFDPLLAATLGFAPVLLHYALMTLISVTAVGAFNAVGSVLVIAFMIGPPITAFLLTHDLKKLIGISSLFAVFNAVVGYFFAMYFDVSIAGSMALITGLSFGVVFLFSPREGLLSTKVRRKHQKREFAELTVLFHLFNHEASEDEAEEAGVWSIYEHLNWSQAKIQKIIEALESKRLILIDRDVIKLTELGREMSIDYANSIFDR
ncbi:metal ABC transporter permease [Erysipelothrix sp. HDW6C]|uniref:metal ABC transporter permease n=1 Tax=Erysipelothrix sp. HDW6C TaxID=2714930 RepID=UPI0014088F3E|nr:metal ABC transporter permease [Erysipelothrix sp. HDW6C]QIK69463.1 metal ABC transporter permease [Erysipelothrix sp. HDW6C]